MFTIRPPSPPHPAHSHLLVFFPFAAVKIKLHVMVAIMSLASWLLLTPNQLFCFFAMFITIAGQIVCFENAKSNSPMCKKEHLIGFQCSLCWFELRANEDRWVSACVCVVCVCADVAGVCSLFTRAARVRLCASSGITAHGCIQPVSNWLQNFRTGWLHKPENSHN